MSDPMADHVERWMPRGTKTTNISVPPPKHSPPPPPPSTGGLRCQCSSALLSAEIARLRARLDELGDWDDLAGWTGLTAETYEARPAQERVFVFPNGSVAPGGCGTYSTDGTRVCTRPSGHPHTRHVSRTADGYHNGEWDDDGR